MTAAACAVARQFKALTGLSFAVRQGEICALIGPNGAGKSSLMNVINGVCRASSGRIVFDGRVIERPGPGAIARLGIGRTFQNNALFRRMSVLDNVLTGLTRLGRAGFFEIAFRTGRHAADPPAGPDRTRVPGDGESGVNLLDNGRVAASGTAAELAARTDFSDFYLGAAASARRPNTVPGISA